MFFDSSYIVFVVPALILAMYAQYKVNSTYKKFAQIASKRGLSGALVARKILDNAGLSDVAIEHIDGELTDHYDPKNKVVRLSSSTFNSVSVAAIGIAAHETGHAIQHKSAYFPIKVRNSIVPVVSIGSNLAFPLAILGIFLGISPLINLGIILFSLVVAFQIITLPVEFNASSRAISVLEANSILDFEELSYAKKVLSAAALTYVAAAAVAAANLLRLIFLANRRR